MTTTKNHLKGTHLMNTARCTRKRPRSIQKLTADLDDIAGDFALIDHSIRTLDMMPQPPGRSIR
jgi:hypothetical protein